MRKGPSFILLCVKLLEHRLLRSFFSCWITLAPFRKLFDHKCVSSFLGSQFCSTGPTCQDQYFESSWGWFHIHSGWRAFGQFGWEAAQRKDAKVLHERCADHLLLTKLVFPKLGWQESPGMASSPGRQGLVKGGEGTCGMWFWALPTWTLSLHQLPGGRNLQEAACLVNCGQSCGPCAGWCRVC